MYVNQRVCGYFPNVLCEEQIIGDKKCEGEQIGYLNKLPNLMTHSYRGSFIRFELDVNFLQWSGNKLTMGTSNGDLMQFRFV